MRRIQGKRTSRKAAQGKPRAKRASMDVRRRGRRSVGDAGQPAVQVNGTWKTCGPGEAMIVTCDRAGRIQVRTIKTNLGVGEIRRAVLARQRHSDVDTGELTVAERGALSRGGFDAGPLETGFEDPVAVAAQEFSNLRRESLTTAAAARVLGVEDSRVRQRLTSRPPTLYGIKVNGEWRVPRFQFEGRSLVPGIDRVVAHLREELNPIAVTRWFASPNTDLPIDDSQARYLSPLEWLRMGRSSKHVAELASDL